MLFQEQAVAPDTTGAPARAATTTYTFTASQPGTYLYEASPFVHDAGRRRQPVPGRDGHVAARSSCGPPTPARRTTRPTPPSTPSTSSSSASSTRTSRSPTPPPSTCATSRPSTSWSTARPRPDTATLRRDRGRPGAAAIGQRRHQGALGGRARRSTSGSSARTATPSPTRGTWSPRPSAPGRPTTSIVDARRRRARAATRLRRRPVAQQQHAAGMGGMLTFLDVTPGAASAPTPPAPARAAWRSHDRRADRPASATPPPAAANVTAAEYFLDALGATGSGHGDERGLRRSPRSRCRPSIAALPAGNAHHLRARPGLRRATGDRSARLIYANADTAGPLTRSVSLSPEPEQRLQGRRAQGDRRRHRHRRDPTSPPPSTRSTAARPWPSPRTAPARSPRSTRPSRPRPSPRSPRARTRSRCAAATPHSNWGAPATVDAPDGHDRPRQSTDPSTNPAASNGVQGVSASTAAVRVKATVTDPTVATVHSTVVAGEGFIDSTSAADGSGFPLVPADGTFNGVQETLRADIPLDHGHRVAGGIPHDLPARP